MSNSSLRNFAVGGHGKVVQHLARHAMSSGCIILPMTCDPAHASDLPNLPASRADRLQPIVASVDAAAGAGGKGGQERTQVVDYECTVKFFDAIGRSKIASNDGFRHLLVVSAINMHALARKPNWYKDKEFECTKTAREKIRFYAKMNRVADKDIAKRSAFPWFVLRPRSLSMTRISPDDVEAVLLKMAELPRESKIDGLMLELTNGDEVGATAEAAVQRGRSDWIG
ncbi:hypothetical protein K437DRAFT_294387 [Tilletiaria anomala UBC 951]|uniref:NAD(P)-binding domain-containing protein n=1 Tax=Tilletiaria anomala (strain ATCC 24038 / CBS 436.72 / UBC 951) TaxID=1037660 RepID=A0A066W5Q9_TILAU|nr:uncharacterized protein K437DRAFT_294387 [Tilletiaria anomala UBC 951]KDN46130.1 hypothetical protein K437DRAFT_294387 [Tilletiaria anomala UBC 951]